VVVGTNRWAQSGRIGTAQVCDRRWVSSYLFHFVPCRRASEGLEVVAEAMGVAVTEAMARAYLCCAVGAIVRAAWSLTPELFLQRITRKEAHGRQQADTCMMCLETSLKVVGSEAAASATVHAPEKLIYGCDSPRLR
jgi:hypothetical protein